MCISISNINLFTRDIEAMHRFYTEVLGLQESSRSAPPTFYLLQAGTIKLTLQDAHVASAQFIVGANTEIGFEAEDLTAIYDTLRENGSVVGAMEQMGWGSGFDAVDPDGNRLSIFKKHT